MVSRREPVYLRRLGNLDPAPQRTAAHHGADWRGAVGGVGEGLRAHPSGRRRGSGAVCDSSGVDVPLVRGPRHIDDAYPDAVGRALRRVATGDLEGARSVLDEIRFEPVLKRVERWPSISVMARVYERDRYQCRYCGDKTILTPVMRLLARLFPDEFPMHPNWKATATHPAFVSRSTTLDHVTPLAGGGDPMVETNLVTACWGCNRRKGDLTLRELGWNLRDPADPTWHGLTELYEPAWIAAGRPALSESEMTWMRATRGPGLSVEALVAQDVLKLGHDLRPHRRDGGIDDPEASVPAGLQEDAIGHGVIQDDAGL